LTPADDVQAAVNAAPTGTTFCFAAGIYNVAIVPKAGQVFDGGNRAAILDGQNSRQYAFRATVADVTVRGFVIRNFSTPLQQGAIHSFGSTGWTIDNNQITQNAATAVATDTGARVTNNLLDHNGQQGYAAHGHDFLYEGNEIAYNNENLTVDATWEAGGGKAWDTQNATFRNNQVHHNGGNGLWDDTNNIYITYDGNNVHDNWGAGIYHEIGYDAQIVNNTVTNNGTSTSQGGGQDLGWMWDAGIQLRSSGALTSTSPIIIRGNTVTDNYNGISLLESPSSGCTGGGEGRYGPCKVQNVLVDNNVITMHIGGTGGVQDGSGSGIFTSQNNHWTGNQYHVPGTHPNDGHAYGWLAWNNSWPSWASWQGYGNDLTGTLGG
jgi:parallel beta-helix repeat protein